MSTQNDTTSLSSENRYILFWVGQELYGTPLLDVREVVEYQEPRQVPNTLPHFSGVINIRGSIVGVVDLRRKFNTHTAGGPEKTKSTALLVCSTAQGVLGAIVDRVDSVVSVRTEDLETKPPVMTRISQDYLIGIAKLPIGLVTMIQLQRAMGEEPMTPHSQPKAAA